MKFIVLVFVMLGLPLTSAQGQEQTASQQTVVIQQLELRRQAEMHNAISCEIGKSELQAKFDSAEKEIADLKAKLAAK